MKPTFEHRNTGGGGHNKGKKGGGSRSHTNQGRKVREWNRENNKKRYIVQTDRLKRDGRDEHIETYEKLRDLLENPEGEA